MNIDTKERACELCNQQASLYCASDSAFLCSNCDATVHHANFLVARHLRHLLCSMCNRFVGNPISGSTPPPLTSTCRSCSLDQIPSHHSPDSLSSSSLSSACVSSSESCAAAATPKKIKAKLEDGRSSSSSRRRRRKRRISCSSSVTDEKCGARAETREEQKKGRRNGVGWEEVFVNWSRESGVNGNSTASSLAVQFCLRNWRALPFRVAAATSFWWGLGFCGHRSRLQLQRLEATSGVPAKLILAAEAKLARAFNLRLTHTHTHTRRRQLLEGWAESHS